MRINYGTYQIRKSVLTCFLLLFFANSYLAAATETNLEKLFTDALDAKGQDYIELRQKILSLSPQNDSYLKEQAKSTDLKTRLIAQAILDRAEKPQEYQHFEELMIVPVTVAVKNGATTVIGARPFETIKLITQNNATLESSRGGTTSGMMMPEMESGANRQILSQNYCHDESAFLFLAEMALKNTMLDVPELSEQIEWTDAQKTYTSNEAAVILGVLPQTAEKWYQAGLFLSQRNPSGNQREFFPLMQIESIELNSPITQLQIRNFYEYFSDKIINPEYLRSNQPVSRVVHADTIYAAERFQQDPGSLFRCYAVLMLENFSKPETPELLYEVYKQDASDYVRAYCVEGFSAKTQAEQIRLAMKDFTIRVESNSNRMPSATSYGQVGPQTIKVPSSLVRRAAVIKSKENPDAFSVSDYIESITPGDYRLNQEIAQVLGVKGDIAAIEPLIEMFKDSSSINSVIAKAIIEIDPNSMYKALEHQDSEIRNNAWSSLAFSDVNFPIKLEYLIKPLNDDSFRIMRLIAKNHPDSLVSFIDNTNPSVRIETIDLLVKNPGKYIQQESPSLKELLLLHAHDPYPKVRQIILVALKKYNSDKEVNKVLIDALKDTDSQCRIAAVGSLKESEETVSIMDTFLIQEKNANVRRSVAHYLSLFREPSRYEVFAKLIHDESPLVRGITARELSEWKDDQAIELLKLLLNDSNSGVQQDAIRSIIYRDIGLLPEIISSAGPELRRAAYNSLGEDRFLAKGQTDKAIDLLIEGTQDPNENAQYSAIWILTKQKPSYELDHPAVSAVQKCLSDNDPRIRSLSVYVLYEMVGENSIDMISGLLYDSDKSVQKEAIRTLARPKSPAAIKYLMEALAKEEDKAALVEMVSALREITGNLLTKDQWMQWWEENKETYLKN